MPQKKKNTRKSRTTQPAKNTRKKLTSTERFARAVANAKKRISEFKKQRPHRSFKLTRRRDYKRNLKVPGYFALSIEVGSFMRRHSRLFVGLIALYSIIVIILGGLTSQQTYITVQDTVAEGVTTNYGEIIGKAGQASMTLLSSLSNSSDFSEVQQLYLAITLILIWMCTVWLAREIMAGREPRVRDGLYNSGAPFISTLIVGFIMLLQLIPVGILALVYSALSGVGLINSGFGAMIFGLIALLVVSLTLYWLTSTFIALVVVTLPGMYPMRALKISSQLVISRRFRVLLRLLWAVFMMIGAWLVAFVPIIMLEAWLRGIWEWLSYVPIVPILLIVMSALTVVYFSLYVYIFYRRLVSDDSVAGR